MTGRYQHGYQRPTGEWCPTDAGPDRIRTLLAIPSLAGRANSRVSPHHPRSSTGNLTDRRRGDPTLLPGRCFT